MSKAWSSVMLAPVNRVVTALIASDPMAVSSVYALAGRAVRVHVTDWDVWYKASFSDGAFHFVRSGEDESSDVTLCGASGALCAALAWRHPGLPPGLEVEGDVALLQDYQALLQTLDVDWGAVLSPYLGDVVGQSVAEGMVGVMRHGRHLFQRRLEDAVIYAQDERAWLPSWYEWQAFQEDVEQLRDDVARLEARWKRRQEVAA